MRISDWSSDVCSSDLFGRKTFGTGVIAAHNALKFRKLSDHAGDEIGLRQPRRLFGHIGQARSLPVIPAKAGIHEHRLFRTGTRSEERRVGKECVSTCRSRWSPYH